MYIKFLDFNTLAPGVILVPTSIYFISQKCIKAWFPSEDVDDSNILIQLRLINNETDVFSSKVVNIQLKSNINHSFDSNDIGMYGRFMG